MLTVERLAAASELRQIRAAWEQLSESHVFTSPAWLSNWWDAYQETHELFVLRVSDSHGDLVGLAPWYLERSVAAGKTLRFLGSGKACTEYQSLLAAPGEGDRVALAVAEWLVDANHSRLDGWDHLDLQAVPQADPAITLLASCLERNGVRVAMKPGPACWRIELPACWEEYQAGLARNVRRKLRKIEKDYFASGRVQQTVARSDLEFEQLFDRLVEFHQRRWDTVGTPGCFTSPQFGSFLRRAANELGGAQRAWLSQVSVDDQPAAVAFFLSDDESELMYQCGMDPAMREHQPGWLLNVANLQTMFRRGIRRCDYLRGEERYKRELGAVAVPQVDWRISAPSSVARFRHTIWLTQDRLRAWGKQVAALRRG